MAKRQKEGESRTAWVISLVLLALGLLFVFAFPFPYDLIGVVALVIGATATMVLLGRLADIDFLGVAPRHDRIIEDRRISAIAGYVGSLSFIGLGIATIDQIQGAQASLGQSAAASPFYYIGWTLVITGFAFFFLAIDTIHFHPAWIFAGSVFLEIYGWWNVYWLSIDIAQCGACHAPTSGAGVDLGDIGFGPIFIPFWAFLVTTALAIIVPIVIAGIAPRDVNKCAS